MTTTSTRVTKAQLAAQNAELRAQLSQALADLAALKQPAKPSRTEVVIASSIEQYRAHVEACKQVAIRTGRAVKTTMRRPA